MFSQTLTAVLIPASAVLLLASLSHAQPRERSGPEVVKAQCVKCHEAGLHGAPKIDDRAAWIPRMKYGVDATVRSAINGHGVMPARGGMANLTDTELRAAILYMFYPAGAELRTAAAPATAPDPHHKLVGGVEFYLGIAPAASAAVSQPHPSGSGYYYVNLTLRETASGVYIKDAQVEARAANAVSGGDTKNLAPMALAESASYGNFFRMQGQEPYVITVHVRRPGAAQAIEARFDFKP
ncbi:MAG TPA: c-type cytochrome [Burkholderiales bacterium]|nr:c-type cytochrome [Burkholderiales bacterium]